MPMKKSILAVLILLAAAPVAADTLRDDDVRARMDPAQITALDQSNDRAALETTAAIRQAILDDSELSRYAQNLIIVTTDDNRVVIRGVVDSSAERERVEQVAQGAAGNRRVQLDLKVTQPAIQ
jgi:osmotically-inducible protein OsmY